MKNVSERSVTNCACFRIPIGICLETAFQFVFRLILWYVYSFFFKFWYFELRFDYIFINCNIFCYNIIKFLLFISESIIFTDFVYIFIYLVDLLFLVIIRQPKYLGGARVCVFDLFLYTRFLYGFLT